MNTTNIVEDKIIHELLKAVDLEIALEDNEILIDALNRTFKEDAKRLNLDLRKITEGLKRKYFEQLRKEFLENLREVRNERKQFIPEKQLMYLAATVFAESILNKPAPASLIFEILRCANMEEERNFPNRYYFLRELEKKGLVRSVMLVNSRAERLYCPTEEGRKTVDGTEAFDMLIKLRDKILQDSKVKRLIDNYSKEEPVIKVDLPKLLETSRIISENDNVVRVLLYGREVVNLSREEIERIDSIAKELGRFRQSDLRMKANNRTKVQAYLVYNYNKGLIDIVGKSPTRGRADSFIFERKNV